MKQMKFAKILFAVTIIFYIAYDWYFGWNEKPINDAEKTCDEISGWMFLASIIFYVQPIFKYLESRVAFQEANEKTEEENKESETIENNE